MKMNEQEEIALKEFQERELRQKEDARKNRLFAVFMGAAEMTQEDCDRERIEYSEDIFKYSTPPDSDDSHTMWHINNMKYHKSWNWLIPVCKKLREINSVRNVVGSRASVLTSRMLVSLIDLDIEKTAKECLELINWLDQTKKIK